MILNLSFDRSENRPLNGTMTTKLPITFFFFYQVVFKELQQAGPA